MAAMDDGEEDEVEAQGASDVVEDLIEPPAGGEEEPPVGGEEARRAKAQRSPVLPSAEEIETHNATHLPRRSWCKACIAGSRVSPPHCRVAADEHLVPTISLDECVLKRKTGRGQPCTAVVVIRDSRTLAVAAAPVQLQ